MTVRETVLSILKSGTPPILVARLLHPNDPNTVDHVANLHNDPRSESYAHEEWANIVMKRYVVRCSNFYSRPFATIDEAVEFCQRLSSCEWNEVFPQLAFVILERNQETGAYEPYQE